MGKKFGISFSWKRALGISGAKSKISRKTGIPLTKSGRQKKMGSCLGCSVLIFIAVLGGILAVGAIASVWIQF